MGYVRPAVAEDIPQIAELYSAVFETGGPGEGLRSALHEIFFGHPWLDDGLPSLVYQTRGQRIVGCLGVMPRPMWMNGRRIQAAISHTVMVDPDSRPTLAGVELIRRFLAGGQDVSLAQGTGLSRRIFEGVGGSMSLLQSLGWTRVLRPIRYVLSCLTRRGLPAACSAALTPVCHTADAITGRILPNPFRVFDAELSGEELDAEMLGRCLSEFSQDRALRPAYDARSLQWLLALLGRQTGDVALHKMLLRDSSQEIVGSYLYYRRRAGIADVVQIAARQKAASQVLDHLFGDAYRRRALAVSGQLDPQFLPALGTKHCLLNRGDGSWLLAHSKQPDILAAIHRGDAFLSRLEAEWWIGFVLIRSLTLDAARGAPQGEEYRPTDGDHVATEAPEALHAVHRS